MNPWFSNARASALCPQPLAAGVAPPPIPPIPPDPPNSPASLSQSNFPPLANSISPTVHSLTKSSSSKKALNTAKSSPAKADVVMALAESASPEAKISDPLQFGSVCTVPGNLTVPGKFTILKPKKTSPIQTNKACSSTTPPTPPTVLPMGAGSQPIVEGAAKTPTQSSSIPHSANVNHGVQSLPHERQANKLGIGIGCKLSVV